MSPIVQFAFREPYDADELREVDDAARLLAAQARAVNELVAAWSASRLMDSPPTEALTTALLATRRSAGAFLDALYGTLGVQDPSEAATGRADDAGRSDAGLADEADGHPRAHEQVVPGARLRTDLEQAALSESRGDVSAEGVEVDVPRERDGLAGVVQDRVSGLVGHGDSPSLQGVEARSVGATDLGRNGSTVPPEGPAVPA